VNGASFQSGASPGSWITITGANLASTSRTWTAAEIVNGVLPTQLDGIAVTINGKPAFVYYISPGQLNVQAPSDTAAGPVLVTVKGPSGTSATATAQLQFTQPAFFLWDGRYPVATRTDFSYVGPRGLFSDATSTPAKPGDTVILWGTGFGPTSPGTPAGQVVSGAPAVGGVTVTIGGQPAQVYGAALAPGSAGLYQIAIQVPASVPDGDQPVIAQVSGASSPAGVFLTVLH
jgi:uncharacterized protein (TIGR03437 family)